MNNISINPSDKIPFDHLENWKIKSAPCKRDAIIHNIASAIILLVGITLTALGLVLFVSNLKPQPISDSSFAISMIGLLIVFPLGLSTTGYSINHFSDFTNYANPQVAKEIVNSYKNSQLLKFKWSSAQLEQHVKYGFISEKSVDKIKDIIKRYQDTVRNLHNIRKFHPLGSPDEAKLVKVLNEIEKEWINNRDGTIAKELPDFGAFSKA